MINEYDIAKIRAALAQATTELEAGRQARRADENRANYERARGDLGVLESKLTTERQYANTFAAVARDLEGKLALAQDTIKLQAQRIKTVVDNHLQAEHDLKLAQATIADLRAELAQGRQVPPTHPATSSAVPATPPGLPQWARAALDFWLDKAIAYAQENSDLRSQAEQDRRLLDQAKRTPDRQRVQEAYQQLADGEQRVEIIRRGMLGESIPYVRFSFVNAASRLLREALK